MTAILLAVLLSFVPPKDYTVLNVKGVVKIKGETKPLVRGSRLGDHDLLQFVQPGSIVTVLSPDKGRMELSVQVDGRSGSSRSNELFYEVSKLLAPSKKHLIMAGRDGSLLDENQFSAWLMQMAPADTALLVIDSMNVPLGNFFKEREDTHFFLLRYEYKKETINKKIAFRKDSQTGDLLLHLDKSIFSIDGKQIAIPSVKELEWFYFDKAEETANLLGKTGFRLITTASISPEICLLYKNIEDRSEAAVQPFMKKQEVYSYLKDYYGSTTIGSVEVLQKHLHCK